jgi:hypothetical protein
MYTIYRSLLDFFVSYRFPFSTNYTPRDRLVQQLRNRIYNRDLQIFSGHLYTYNVPTKGLVEINE